MDRYFDNHGPAGWLGSRRSRAPRIVTRWGLAFGSTPATPAARRGLSLLEVTVAAAMLAVLLTTSGRLVRVLINHQRAVERQAVALQAAQAVLEQATNTAWDELTAESARQMEIPAAIAPVLPGAKLVVAVAEDEDPIVAKRVSVELSWNGAAGKSAGPVRLTAWVYPERPLPQSIEESP